MTGAAKNEGTEANDIPDTTEERDPETRKATKSKGESEEIMIQVEHIREMTTTSSPKFKTCKRSWMPWYQINRKKINRKNTRMHHRKSPENACIGAMDTAKTETTANLAMHQMILARRKFLADTKKLMGSASKPIACTAINLSN